MNSNFIVLKKSRTPFSSERLASREFSTLSFSQTYILSLVLIAVLGIYYVWTLNVNATKGYNIRNLELAERNLISQQDLLNVKIAEAESLDSITSSPSAQNMQTVDSPQYLVLKDAYFSYSSAGVQ